jgi:hypothetical protein
MDNYLAEAHVIRKNASADSDVLLIFAIAKPSEGVHLVWIHLGTYGLAGL